MEPRTRDCWRRVLSVLVLSGAAAATGTGCDSLGGARAMNDDSILSIVAPPSASDAAAMMTDQYSADNRVRGLAIIASEPYGGEDAYVQWYEVALEDSDPAVRSAAVRALGRHGEPRHVPMIVKLIDDPDPTLRWEVVRTLQRLHNPVAIGPLLDRVRARTETVPDVRAGAATALGQYADARVVDGLITALDDRELLVNRAARQSLVTLTGQDFEYDVRSWLGWKDSTGNLFAARGEYVFPAFHRSAEWWEVVVPWLGPPNEASESPVGMASSDGGG
ncbi:MAG: HEAT repeat domain-containing protein [Phycisphaerales bacterium]|nr:HEAT repeat domain-containing protein [Phycisphaerales bacterium]